MPALLLDHQPAVVEERNRVGDWARDLIIGRGGFSAVGTLACRLIRYIKLIHLPGRRTADELIVGIRQTVAEMPESVRP